MEDMDSKPYQPLPKGRHEMEMSYTSSSDESEDGRAHHRSYTSRETLPDYTHELRLTLGSHRERQSNYSQPQPGTAPGRGQCVYLQTCAHICTLTVRGRKWTLAQKEKQHTHTHTTAHKQTCFKRAYVNYLLQSTMSQKDSRRQPITSSPQRWYFSPTAKVGQPKTSLASPGVEHHPSLPTH